jgi:hypothetical protein
VSGVHHQQRADAVRHVWPVHSVCAKSVK